MPAKTPRKTQKPARTRRPHARATTHQLKVTLRGSTPPIWQSFIVPSHIDFGMLHTILQAVMDWSNSHMHQFEVDGRRITDPAFGLEGGEPIVNEHTVELRD